MAGQQIPGVMEMSPCIATGGGEVESGEGAQNRQGGCFEIEMVCQVKSLTTMYSNRMGRSKVIGGRLKLAAWVYLPVVGKASTR